MEEESGMASWRRGRLGMASWRMGRLSTSEKRAGEKNGRKGGRERGGGGMGKGKVVQTRRSGTVNCFSTVKAETKRDKKQNQRDVRLSQSKTTRGERTRAGFPGKLPEPLN